MWLIMHFWNQYGNWNQTNDVKNHITHLHTKYFTWLQTIVPSSIQTSIHTKVNKKSLD